VQEHGGWGVLLLLQLVVVVLLLWLPQWLPGAVLRCRCWRADSAVMARLAVAVLQSMTELCSALSS
jgi:hypothetical protein